MKKPAYIVLIAACVSALCVLSACMSIPASIVSTEDWFKKLPQFHSASCYRSGVHAGFLPFISAKADHIDSLALIDLADDPVYESFEIQRVIIDKNEGNNKSSTGVIIAVRKDGIKDYYYQSEFPLNPQRWQSVGALLGTVRFHAANFQWHLQMETAGLDAAFCLTDFEGRSIKLFVREHSKNRKPSGILAPVSVQATEPTAFPFVYLDNFSFVPVHATSIHIEIDGVPRKPLGFPVFLDGQRVYYSRYSSRVAIADLVPEGMRFIPELTLPTGTGHVQEQGVEYELRWNNGHPELQAVSVSSSDSRIALCFKPCLPDLLSLKAGLHLSGRFVISVNTVGAVIAGTYTINTTDDGIDFTLSPQKGWQPPGMSEKTWVSTFLYKASIQKKSDGAEIQSDWFRLKK